MTAPANVHVLLVSAQAAPNLLPLLDPNIKPAEAVLLVSNKMRPQAEALEQVLRQANVKTSRVDLVDEHDFDSLETTLLDLAAARSGQSIALNLTGGTKLMALAAQSIAQAANWSMFYVDVDTDEVIWLGKGAAPRQKLTESSRLRHYLMAYGFSLGESAKTPPLSAQKNDLLDTLIRQIGSLEQPLSQLNWLGQTAESKRRLRVQLDVNQQDSPSLHDLQRNFEQAGVLRVEHDQLIFADEDELAFAKGGWLERYVYAAVDRLTGDLGVRDKASNQEVIGRNNVKNELDVAFMARNRLFVIECKTARMDKPGVPKANESLFKLAEICKRVGGLGTRGLLASYRRLGEAEKQLAQALNIELVCGAELLRLDERLRHWVRR